MSRLRFPSGTWFYHKNKRSEEKSFQLSLCALITIMVEKGYIFFPIDYFLRALKITSLYWMGLGASNAHDVFVSNIAQFTDHQTGTKINTTPAALFVNSLITWRGSKREVRLPPPHSVVCINNLNWQRLHHWWSSKCVTTTWLPTAKRIPNELWLIARDNDRTCLSSSPSLRWLPSFFIALQPGQNRHEAMHVKDQDTKYQNHRLDN